MDKKKIEDDKTKYDEAKRVAKKEMWKAREVERKKFGDKLEKENEKGKVLRVAKQMVRNNRDVVGGGCVKDTKGRIVFDEHEVLETWRAYYDKLSNEEFPWNKDTLTADAIDRPFEKIIVAEVQTAIKKMKSSKAAGPSGVVADMLKAAVDV